MPLTADEMPSSSGDANQPACSLILSPVGELLQFASIPEARKGALTQRRLFFI